MNKHPLIRTIYLYLFALVGLTLLVIGGVRFLDMGLKAFIFTKADEEQRIYFKQPTVAPLRIESAADIEENEKMSVEEKAALRQWLIEYNNWKNERDRIDPVVAQRHRNASLNLAMILVGLPLYFFHWRIIKRETKNKEQVNAAT